MKKIITILATIMLLSGCAQQPDRIANTYWPEAIFHTDKASVMNKLIGHFTSAGAILEHSGSSFAKFSIPVDGERADLLNMFLGSGYSEAPRVHINLVVTDADEGTKAILQFWTAVQQGNGTWKRFEMDNNNEAWNTYQELLWEKQKEVNQIDTAAN